MVLAARSKPTSTRASSETARQRGAHLRLPEPWHSAIAETGKWIAGRALMLINFL